MVSFGLFQQARLGVLTNRTTTRIAKKEPNYLRGRGCQAADVLIHAGGIYLYKSKKKNRGVPMC